MRSAASHAPSGPQRIRTCLLLSTVLLHDYSSKDILLVWLVGGPHDKGTCQFAPNANVPEITGNPAYSFSGTLDYEEPLSLGLDVVGAVLQIAGRAHGGNFFH